MAPRDFAAVIALWRNTPGVRVGDADTPPKLRRYLAHNPRMSFVAAVGGAVAGAVLCGHDGRRGYLYHLAVDPAHRGRQIGSGLVDRCMRALARAGITRCNILVLADNAGGRAFWRRCGWETYDGVIGMYRNIRTARR